MSRNERERLKIMAGMVEQELTRVQAAGLMGLCYAKASARVEIK